MKVVAFGLGLGVALNLTPAMAGPFHAPGVPGRTDGR
jgi:hypothetical protein